MARAKRFSDVRRMLLRKLPDQDRATIEALRDYLWDSLIVRDFMVGYSTTQLVERQPDRRKQDAVESAIRRVMRRPERG